MSGRDIPLTKEWGVVRLHTSETPSKDRLGQVTLMLVSGLHSSPRFSGAEELARRSSRPQDKSQIRGV